MIARRVDLICQGNLANACSVVVLRSSVWMVMVAAVMISVSAISSNPMGRLSVSGAVNIVLICCEACLRLSMS